MVKDPVCGMDVNEKKSKFKATHEGKTFHFCSSNCKTNFEKNPVSFIKA